MKKIYASFNFDRISPELAQLILKTLGNGAAVSPCQDSDRVQTSLDKSEH